MTIAQVGGLFPMFLMTDEQALQDVKRAASLGQVRVRNHAAERIAQRGATARDVENAIRTAKVAVYGV